MNAFRGMLPAPPGPASHPPELPEAEAVVPDLGHVADLVALELHDVDVVGLDGFAGGGDGAAVVGVGGAEDAEAGDVSAFLVDGEGLDLVAGVGREGVDADHPVGVGLKCLDLGERVGLRGKGGAGRAVLLADVPALAGFAGVEELECGFFHRGHGVISRADCSGPWYTKLSSLPPHPAPP